MRYLEPFTAYKMYLTLRLHFTSRNYDISKNGKAVNLSRESFLKKHNEIPLINSLSEKYCESDLAEYFIANFTAGDAWGGLYTGKGEGASEFMNWKKQTQN